jgi:lipoprotein LpqH
MADMAKRNRSQFSGDRLLFLNASVIFLIATAVGACSSSPTSLPPGALPAGTAKVTINDRALPETTAVKCTTIGPLTTIATGDQAAGITALVSNEGRLTAKSVTITDLGGFTGSYTEGLSGNADTSMKDQTYVIRGTAAGFDTAKPNQRTTASFAVRVAC